jgi:hypothetical protein
MIREWQPGGCIAAAAVLLPCRRIVTVGAPAFMRGKRFSASKRFVLQSLRLQPRGCAL